MNIEVEKPNIVRIKYHQEPDDPNYGSCMWAFYDFDLDEYILNIQSDCGDASYGWVKTPKSESFFHLMARINDDYLINKLFKDESVDVDATIEQVRELLGIGEDEDYRDDYLTIYEREEREEALNELKNTFYEYGHMSADACAHLLDEWNREHDDYEISDIWEYVQTDFTAMQKRIVQIFADYIQPKIKEILREETA